MMQSPDDAHGSAALMAHVIGWPEKRVRTGEAVLSFAVTNQNEYVTPTVSMVDVPLAGPAVHRGCALGLPVK